ncbi:hypothetical protein ZOSMA_418G00030 [Zostera marina]|uniref:Methyltransferase-like protein 1 n=1 Tax=Zostera marina TaxID=29655 RepID=A0A0K9P2V5_ZOSMR|nr:hypothetical protein ZOSMA_418G00030 [Zostera marina]
MKTEESSLRMSKRTHEDVGKGVEEEEDWDGAADRRKHRSGKSRKQHGNVEEVEEQRGDGGNRRGSGDSRKKATSGSNRVDSGDEEDYDIRRDLRLKVSKRNIDVETETSSRKGRNSEGERGYSKKSSTKTSGHDVDLQSGKNRSRVERGLHDAEYEKVQDKDSRYAERKDGNSSRDKGHGSRDQERSGSRRRWDEVDPGRKYEESSHGDRSESKNAKVSDRTKHGHSRDIFDSKNETAEGKTKYSDAISEKNVKSSNREDKRVDGEWSKSRSRPDSVDRDTRQVFSTPKTRQDGLRDDKQRRDSERLVEDGDKGGLKTSGSRMSVEKSDKHKQQRETVNVGRDYTDAREKDYKNDEDGHSRIRERSNREGRTSRRSRTPDRRHYRDADELDRGYSESDNERGGTLKGNKDRDRDDRPSKGKESGWSDRSREKDASKDNWKRSHPSRQDREHRDGDNEFEYDKDWDSKRREQDWVDSDKLHNRPPYRKGNRTDSSRLTSNFSNVNEHSDTIEIRPNKNLDYGREEPGQSYQGRRTDGRLSQENPSGANDDDWRYQSEDRGKATYDHGDDFQERYPEDGSPMEQSSRRNALDSQGSKARGQKSFTNSSVSVGTGQVPNSSLQPSYGNNQGSGTHNRSLQQALKSGGRHGRGGRGRIAPRDNQRVSMPLAMMGPPYGHIPMPPVPMSPMGPNVPPTPGAPMGPNNIFMPPFPGSVIWPGPRGVDINMLAAPPVLSPIPSGPVGPRFPPNMPNGPNHGMFYNQSGPGRGVSPGLSGPMFNSLPPVGRGMPLDKTSSGWVPPRSSGPPGKAPSRGEQNDYSQNFVDTGMRPQNFIRELELTNTVEDYPKLRELIQKKDEIVTCSNSLPMYYKCDLHEHVLSPEFFGTKFDVILVDPPWEEYLHRAPGSGDHMECWSFEDILNLKIEAIADTPSFIFLWVGDGMGLEQGRQCLKKWGFRRCEDICWVKTNKVNAAPSLRHDSHTLFQHSKEHCLMGIKGTVRRSTDGHIIHANIDTDIIIAEEPPYGSTTKPEDIYRIIEHFSLGRRRLELFGAEHNIRSGWLTVGKDLSSSNFDSKLYCENFADKDGKVWQGGGGRNPPPDAPHLVLTTSDIESLRPKSPPAKNQQPQTSISTTVNSSKRPLAPLISQQPIPTVPSLLSVNQEVSSSNPPAILPSQPWSTTPMPLQTGINAPASCPPNDGNMFLDNYGFNPS